MKRRVAILAFPGMNCEEETALGVTAAGADGIIVRYNALPAELEKFDAYVLPGGFSYQDRVRAGVIAAKDRLLEVVTKAADAGKPILGICNGAQVLVEAGLVPELSEGQVEVCLAANHMVGRSGYYCRWVFMKAGAKPERNFFTSQLEPGEVLPIPMAHAEGRFVTADGGTESRLVLDDLGALAYCRADGAPAGGFPHNPNGSLNDLAAVGNPAGNVLAMMPHPERASWLAQVPMHLEGVWGERRRSIFGGGANYDAAGPGLRILGALGR
jgi:phosphoribosylformylglycinamidine synthase subunit PurQ / glutaminase